MRVAIIAVFAVALIAGRRAEASPDHDAGPVHVDFKIESPDHKGALAAGALDCEPFEWSHFEANDAGDIQSLKMKLSARPQRDGTVGVWVEFDEVDRDGHEVKWAPAIEGKRGVPLVATIHAGDLSRSITVTIK